MQGSMAAALAPFRHRMPQSVRTQEVLRVASSIPSADTESVLPIVQKEALKWAQRRCGGQLPLEAWRGDDFDYLAGGRTTLGVRIADGDINLWALSGDDPDKNVPGRVWRTELVFGSAQGAEPRLSLRLLVSAVHDDKLEFDPHVPGLLKQLTDNLGLKSGGYPIGSRPWLIKTSDDVADLVEMLESRNRRFPIFVASGDERSSDPEVPAIDVASLGRAVLGLAQVVVLPAAASYGLSDSFGKTRSVYHGAVRIYGPGFDAGADPYAHPLMLGEAVRNDPASCIARLRHFAATESLRRTQLDRDVLSFSAVRNEALQRRATTRELPHETLTTRLSAFALRVQALEATLETTKGEVDRNFRLACEEDERAKEAEAENHRLRARIEVLESGLRSRNSSPEREMPAPDSWVELADWADRQFAGRLVILSSARANLRKAVFEDVAVASRCLRWLANECRDRRMHGGGSLANVVISNGIENAPCGSDMFRFDYAGRRLNADWHIKNGGNTRDPSRCLRIYYAWDEVTRQIVVAHLPSHQRTGAT